MFAYCLNSSINFCDNDGKDAIMIQEEESAATFGHTGLIVQDKDGNWWYFYWGPIDENDEIPNLILGVSSRCVVVCLGNANQFDMSTLDGIKAAVASSQDEFVSKRSELITQAVYYEGDYEPTYQYIVALKKKSPKQKYMLLLDNCVQESIYALSCSDKSLANYIPLWPNLAFTKGVAMGIGTFLEATEEVMP